MQSGDFFCHLRSRSGVVEGQRGTIFQRRHTRRLGIFNRLFNISDGAASTTQPCLPISCDTNLNQLATRYQRRVGGQRCFVSHAGDEQDVRIGAGGIVNNVQEVLIWQLWRLPQLASIKVRQGGPVLFFVRAIAQQTSKTGACGRRVGALAGVTDNCCLDPGGFMARSSSLCQG
jgi:hypothetical protein